MSTLLSSVANSSVKGAMVPIQTVTLASNGGIVFNNVPQIYQDLMVIASLRSAYASSLDVTLFEWGYTTNYSYTALRSNGASVDSYRGTGAYGIYCNSTPAATASANIFGSFIAHIFDYTNSTRFKNALIYQAYDLNGSGGFTYTVGTKNTTDAVTMVEVGGGNAAIAAGSTATLYGIKKAGQ
jgi:hypothetical protein